MLKKILNKLNSESSKSNNNELDFDSNLKLYSYPYKDKTIYSHNKACIQRAQRQILENEVYHFESDKNPKIIDAGANIGIATLYWKTLFPDAEIIAFEPSKDVFEVLQKNVKLNDLNNVTLVNKALSDKEGTMQFTSNEKISGSLILEKNLPNNYTVEVERLSPYLNDPVDFLKIDIEGAERQVFPEIQDQLKNVKNLFLEYHAFEHEELKLSEILQILERENFKYYIEDDFKVNRPLSANYTSLGQTMKLNIWACNQNKS